MAKRQPRMGAAPPAAARQIYEPEPVREECAEALESVEEQLPSFSEMPEES